MKNILKNIWSCLLAVPACLFCIILFIGYLLFVPFDIIRYHKSPYYKESKKKYQFFSSSNEIEELYNYIVKNNLPIEYVSNEGLEYFVKDKKVFLPDWIYKDFDEHNGEWNFIFDNGSEDTDIVSVKEALNEGISKLKEEHRNLPAKILIFYNTCTDAQHFEKAKNCPYFHCENSIEDFAAKYPNYEWKDIVEIMYDQELSSIADEVVEVIYSRDKSMRYVITKDEQNLFSYFLEEIYPFDEDEWKYIDKNGGALPAMWQSPPGCNFNSIFAAKEDALKAMKSEAYYKEYFYVDEQVP